MDIERLKEVVNMERVTSYDKYGIFFEAEYSEDILDLIDAEISRQSVKSEEVRIALTWFEELDKHEIVQRIKICPDYTCTMPDHVVLTIITALKAYELKGE